ncbi:MAG: ATP-binding cassette, subfamily bacterial [Gaiellaceae bacterium]|jgi:ATP-binding cassette subfamily B protein|nr:ATP-binding cassette, subfamily bacterial [Gaiellaceae bacterium]
MAWMDGGWSYLGDLSRRLRWTIVGAILSGLAWQGAALAAPLLIRHAVDAGIVHGRRGALWWACAGVVALGAVEAVSGALRHYFAIRNRAKGDAAVRDGIFRRALELDAHYHDRVGAGDLISRASNDAELVARVFDSIGHTIGYVLTIVGASSVLLVIDWRLGLAVLAPLPLLSIGFGRYSARYAARTKINQEQLGELTSLVEETISGIRVVKGLGAGAPLAARFRRRSNDVVRTALDVAAVDAVFLPALEALPLVGILVVLWYGGHRVLAGDITVGTFALFNFYLALLVNPLRTIGQRVSTVQRGVAAARRVVDVLSAQPTVVESPTPRSFPERSDVRFDDVRFAYGDDRLVLDGFSLEIPAGTSLALVGATGSGKSTAAALLARFYDPEAGRVTIGGIDVRELKLEELRRGVGIVFEETFLFGDTVRGNVGFAAPQAPEGEVERAAELAGAADFVERLPEGYETILGERGFSLSGGQRQRIAIARAILADPQVLILDDATSAVDATKEHEIRTALGVVMQGRTTLVIAHRPATIALADRVAVVDQGRVVEQGTHAELLGRSERYRSLLALAAQEAA